MRNLLDAVRWLCIGLAAIVFVCQLAVVLMRYLLGVGFVELQDTVSYAFAALVALSVAVTFHADRHVRVDVFRQNWSARFNKRIDWVGDLLFALPVFGLMVWTAFPLVRSSWAILEGSRETGGLPGLFVVKTCLVILPALIVLMVIARVISALRRRDV
jgi:TRAP-type mannitol/chloroaromatic compound transport system permease small subunit